MEESQAIDAFGALAHTTRLRLFRLLAAAGPEGMAAGVLAATLDVPTSTLSHHLATLERAGLIAHRRRQRSLLYAVAPDGVRGLIGFLVEDCCEGRPEICGLGSGFGKGCA
jgi:ArsR family transcriptional regulator